MSFRRIMTGFVGNPSLRGESAKHTWEGFSRSSRQDILLHPLQRGNRPFSSRQAPPCAMKGPSLLFVFLTILFLQTLSIAQASSSENPPLRGAAAARLRGVTLGNPGGTSPSAPFKDGITPYPASL